MKPLVCVFAHPDDEAMGPGGSIAKFASERDVYLLCATSGNAKASPDQESLAKVRKEEVQRSAQILGIKKVDFLEFNDGELNNNNYHNLAQKIEEKVNEYEPDTLLTFDINGLTGHLDHIAVSLTTSFVFQKLDFVKNLLYFCEVKEEIEDLYKNYFIYVPPGYDSADVQLIVDIEPFLEQKKQAISAHQSQKEDVDKLLNYLDKKNTNKEYFRKLEK